MYIEGHRFFPALGKTAEAKRLLADHVKHLNDQGQRILLLERIFTSEGPELLTSRFASDLAEIEQVRRARPTDQDFQTRVGQWLPLLREPARAWLWESVVEAPPDPVVTPIIEYVFLYPAAGQERPVVAGLSEMVGELHKLGDRASLWRQIYSSDGPRIMVAGRYVDLAELDRAVRARSELGARAGAALIGLMRAPLEDHLSETIVALPPA